MANRRFPSTDVISKALPVTINNDDTGIEFKAALQLRAEFGINSGTNGKDDITMPGIGGVDIPFVDLPDIGAGAVVGAFVNLVEYVADVSPEDDCALEAIQELNLNMGVFAKVGVNIEDEFLGLRPSATTTLLTLPLPSACLLETGLPAPTRETPLPTAGECGTKTTASAKDDEEEEDEGDKVKTTATKPAQDKTTAAPHPTATPSSHKERAEPSVKELTAVACASQMADCPDDLQTTVTYKTTICDAPAKTGSCFAIMGAETLEPTSVVNTKDPAKATGAVHAENVKGTGTGTDTASAPKRTTASEENASEDESEDDSPADGSSSVAPPVTPSAIPSAAPSAAPSGSSNTSAPAPEPTAEPEPEDAPSGEGLVETGGGSRLVESPLALAVAGIAAFILL